VLSGEVRRMRRSPVRNGPTHILFCIADHFEPAHGQPGRDVERARVAAWTRDYPRLAERFADADGRPPQHTFFYPAESYEREHLDALSTICRTGFGDVEVHLHHDHDTADNLRECLERFADTLFHQHGLLRRRADGRLAFGFVHGNWALDNARPDGRWCGVNNELDVLRDSGCYADFTLPAAPDSSQTRTVNAIYYATDNPARPRSHEYGIHARVGRAAPPDSLLLIQGPLLLDWRHRMFGLLPRIENGALDASPGHQPSVERFAAWVSAGIAVEKRPDWIFVKVHTHGAPEANAATLLGPTMQRFHADINRVFNDGERFRLHYVTAYEMANLVRAAEDGATGSPSAFKGSRS
jgi:hypothetical protein